MTTFVHAPLLWGMLLVGIPVLIHLINMLRHRRVRWAAMEFLRQSQKKNRTWVLLKQLLLLALRMAILAAIVLLVAQPRLRGRFSGWFGDATHHVVLLDDSFSMSDRWQDTSAFDQAKAVVQRIADAVGREGLQTFTLLRFSQAGRPERGTQPDLFQEPVDAEFAARVHEVVAPLVPSESAAGPSAALDAIDQFSANDNAQQRVVYLVSDFRAREWNDPAALGKRLKQWSDAGTQIHLIDCVDAERPNLAVTALTPLSETRAASVFFFAEVAVENFGNAPVKDVAVLIEADGQAQPAITIPSIPARGTVRERFPLRFVTAGEHQVTARLEADAVAADNFRFAVISVPLQLPVLLVDGDSQAQDARYLSAVFNPGGPVTTGINPRIENPRYLSANPLDAFRAVYLLNVDRLDQSAVAALEQYVQAGGGLAFFLGERTQPDAINAQLYRDGQGLFPLPIGRPKELFVDYLEKAPDLEVTAHPIFQVFSGNRNSFLPLVNISRYIAAAKGWKAGGDNAVDVLARLRNGDPLVVERRFGRGRVVAFLTTAAPTWNNWARENPSFIVTMLELQSYLARRPAADLPQVVGAPIELALDPSQYEPQVRFTTPEEAAAATATTEATLAPSGKLVATLVPTNHSGIYQAKLLRKDGRDESRHWAYNVEAEEGDLRPLMGPDLAERLSDVRYRFYPAAAFQYDPAQRAGFDLGRPLLIVLLLVLVGEQILAWSASYHPPSNRAGAPSGGAR